VFGLISFFWGCTQTHNSELILKMENHNKYYQTGTNLIEPYVRISDKVPILDNSAKENIMEGIRYLDAVTKINPYNFAAFWFKGKGYQALEIHDSAYVQFKNAYQLKKDNPDMARELMLECLSLGKGQEAVELSLHALTLDSLNSGLMANLALAYLFNGDLDLSRKTIIKAILANPTDKINCNVKKIIDDVISGKMTKPSKYDDLEL
jgi:tetratricopeptide (TPR) repeat protein